MNEFDSLLQDFSYLKSLEFKDRIPAKLDQKLYLPDPSCIHVLRKRFEETNEISFKRVFRRPIGRRCFEDFVGSPEQLQRDPLAQHLVEFCRKVDGDGARMKSANRSGSLKEAADTYKTYVEHKLIKQHPKMWKNPALKKSYSERCSALSAVQSIPEDAIEGASGTENVQISSTALFQNFVQEAKTYLAGKPWDLYLRSDYFIRYAQWKQLELNMKVNEKDFDIHRILGRGGFGEVYGCRKRDTGAMFAMKQLDKKRVKNEGQELSVIHERNVLAEITSKFVTNLKYAFQDKSKLYLVMDLMEGGDLAFHLRESRHGQFTESQAKFYGAEICLGLAHLHSRNFIYRDLKPANVLLSGDGHARISDMGLVRDCSRTWPSSACGTHGYMAPEVIQENTTYGFAADWFSFGCLMYELLTGVLPFRSRKKVKRESHDEIDRKTLAGVYDLPSSFTWSTSDFLSRLLKVDPTQRLGGGADGTSDWQSIQNHRFFRSIDWAALSEWNVTPAIIPRHGQVNAKNVLDIGSDERARQARRVKMSNEYQTKFYKNFDHVMSHPWQQEVLPLFDMITAATNKKEKKRFEHVMRKEDIKLGTPSGEVALEGFMLKESGHSIFREWSKRYVHILSDRIEWRGDIKRSPQKIIKYTNCDIEMVSPNGTDRRKILVISSLSDNKSESLKALYESDEPYWFKILNNLFYRATGKDFMPEHQVSSESDIIGLSASSEKHADGEQQVEDQPVEFVQQPKKTIKRSVTAGSFYGGSRVMKRSISSESEPPDLSIVQTGSTAMKRSISLESEPSDTSTMNTRSDISDQEIVAHSTL